MKKRNSLLTGATVGFYVLKQLLEKKYYHVSVFDKKTKHSVEKLAPFKSQIQLVFGDITNPSDLDNITNRDAVIHLAAIIPPSADEHPELAQKVNAQGTQNLIQQLEKQSPKAFFLYHDENSDGICNRNMLGSPKEGYGFSNNIKPKPSAPSFKDCKFSLTENTVLDIALIK